MLLINKIYSIAFFLYILSFKSPIQLSLASSCLKISTNLRKKLKSDLSLNDIYFEPEVIARIAYIVETVIESKWAPDLRAFSKYLFVYYVF